MVDVCVCVFVCVRDIARGLCHYRRIGDATSSGEKQNQRE